MKITRDYFVDAVGLEVKEEAPCCLTFEPKSQPGYVQVTLNEQDGKFEVRVETREYEYWAKKFGEKL